MASTCLTVFFEPILKTWSLKRTFLIKLTNCNTYLSMQYKSTYPVNGFKKKETLTAGNYPSVLTNLSHILFLLIEDTLFWLCKRLLYTKSKLNEKKLTNYN